MTVKELLAVVLILETTSMVSSFYKGRAFPHSHGPANPRTRRSLGNWNEF